MNENDLTQQTYYAKMDFSGSGATESNKDFNYWTNTTTDTFYNGNPYYDGKTNVPWIPQENLFTNFYDKWKIPENNWPPSYPTVPNSPFDPFPNSPFDPFPTLPSEHKVDKNLQNLINQLQVELAEQKEELNKITKKCDRLSKNNKKLKNKNEELEKRNKKLNKFSRFDIIEINDDEN